MSYFVARVAPSQNASELADRVETTATDLRTAGNEVLFQRICDGCCSPVGAKDTDCIKTCGQAGCKTTYDLCGTCVKGGIKQDACPRGYGCNRK